MGAITVSLKEKTENKIRQRAKEKYEGKKGSMAKVIEEAIDRLEEDEEKERRHAWERIIARMEKGYHLGKILIKHRSELYERK